MGKLHQWANALKQVFFPVDRCLLCGQPTKAGPLCELCLEDLQAARRCPRCGIFLADQTGYCPYCNLLTKFPYERMIAAAPYEGELRQQLLAFKYRQRTWVVRPFVDLLELALTDLDLTGWTVTAVPLAAGKLRERGYNQAGLIAKELAKRHDLPYLARTLVRCAETPALHNLKKNEREQVVKKAFAPGDQSVAGKNLLLVDDIYTTGATTSACAKVLRRAGAARVIVVAVAAAKV